MGNFLSFLKKAGKTWLYSWRGSPLEPAKPTLNTIAKISGGGSSSSGLFATLFSTLNSVFSAGAAGFTLVTMLVTTALGVVPVVFDTAIDPYSPLSIQASQEIRATLRIDNFTSYDEYGEPVLVLLAAAPAGESFLEQMVVFHNTVDVVAELRENDIDVPIDDLMEILATFDMTETPQLAEIAQEVVAVIAQQEAEIAEPIEPEPIVPEPIVPEPPIVHVVIADEEPEQEPETEPPTEPETEPETEPPTEPETVPPTEPETEPPTEPETEPETEPPTEPETEPETEPPTEPETEPETEPPTEPETEPETEPPTEPETEPSTDPTPSPGISAPDYTAPVLLAATFGQNLSAIQLPAGWAWNNPNALVGNAGTRTHAATFTPANTAGYSPVTENWTITVGRAAQTGFFINAPGALAFGGVPVALTTQGGQAGAVTWELVGGDAITIAAATGFISIESAGEFSVRATRAGDANHYPIYHTLTATVTPRNLENVTISILPAADLIFTGNPITPYDYLVVTDFSGSQNLALSSDFSVVFTNNTNAGTATITLTATGDNYFGTMIGSFTIERKDLSDADITIPGAFIYTATAHMPAISAQLNGATLVYGVDFEISHADNTDAGVATATITGIGNHIGTASGEFTIAPAPLTIVGWNITKQYDGSDAVTNWGALNFDGLQGGEMAAVYYGGVAGVFAQTTVGMGISVTFTGYFGMYGGTANPANYEITQPAGLTGAITQTAAPALEWPTTNPATFSRAQTLADIPLVSDFPYGNFAWQAPDTMPTVANSGFVVIFTPTQHAIDNFGMMPATNTVQLTVNRAAAPIITWPEVGDIIFGEPLSASALSLASNDHGAFAWENPTHTPNANPGQYFAMIFTPNQLTLDNYETIATTTQNVAITVNRAAMPTINWPAAGNITFGQPLSASDLSGGSASGTADGSFAWENPTHTPNANPDQYFNMLFTPDALTIQNYDIPATITNPIPLTVNRAAAPTINWPTAEAITFGQPLSASDLSGGTIGGTADGSFAWENPTQILNAGTHNSAVIFTPDALTLQNYDIAATVSGDVSITVNYAAQTDFAITDPGAITYGDTNITLATTGGQGDGAVTWAVTDGSAVSIDPTTGAITILSAGSAEITATRAGGINHNEITATLNITVYQRDITDFTVGTFVQMTFDGTAQTPQAAVTLGGLTATGTWSEVTNVADSTTFTASGNFAGTIANQNPGMSRAAQTGFAINPPGVITFGDASVTLTAAGGQSAGLIVWELTVGDAVGIDENTGVVEIQRAGDFVVQATLEGDGNHYPVSAILPLSIARAPLSVAANPAAKVFGADMPALSYTISGFVAGDDISVVRGGAEISVPDYAIGDAPGDFEIIVALGTLEADNYYFAEFIPASLSVGRAEQPDFAINDPGVITFGQSFVNLSTAGGLCTGAITWEIISGNAVATIAPATGIVTIENAGNFTVRARRDGDANHLPAYATQTFTIEQRDISLVNITVTSTHVYNSAAQTPEFTVTDGSANLVLSADFTAEFFNNTNAGTTARITLTAAPDGNYTGTATVYFTISRAPGENAPDFALPTNLTATFGNTLAEIVLPAGWQWDAPGNTPAGAAGTQTHAATFTPASNNFYPAQANLTITIAQAQQPALTITDPGILTFGDAPVALQAEGGSVGDITWALMDGDAVDIAPLTGMITIERVGIFTIRATRAGDDNHAPVYAEITLTIARRSVTNVVITVTSTHIYDGAAQTPTFTVTDGSANLAQSADFTAAFSNNINAGDATITITATTDGNYAGFVTSTFAIAPATVTISGFYITRSFIGGNYAVTAWGDLQFDGMVGGQTAIVYTGGVQGTFAQSVVGMHAVTITGEFEMRGGNANPENYMIIQPTGLMGNITPATGEFGAPDAITVTFAPGLTLADVTPPNHYTWVDPATPLTVLQSGSPFPAIFTDPSGNFAPAPGYIIVNIAQAAPTYTLPTGLSATFGDTLADVLPALPDGWAWVTASAYVGNVGEREHAATYTPADPNFAMIERNLTVTVNRAAQTDFAITDPGAITYGDSSITLATTGGQGDGAVAWAVTDGNAVEIDPSTGAITILSAGSAEITATRDGGANHNEITATIDITVAPRNIAEGVVGAFAPLTFTGAPQTPSATVTIGGLVATGTWSEVTNIIDTTTFTASGNFAGTIANQNPGMSRAGQTGFAITDPGTITYGDSSITLATTGGQGDGAITWVVTGGGAVSIDINTGAITILGAGGAEITATRDGGANHNATSATLDIAVNPRDIAGFAVGAFASMTFDGTPQTPQAAVTQGGLTATGTWSEVTNIADTTTFTASGNFAGTIANQNSGMSRADQTDFAITDPGAIIYGDISTIPLATTGGQGDGTITWAVTAGNAVEIGPTTGVITPLSAGGATITATRGGGANHNIATATLDITVNPRDIAGGIIGTFGALTFTGNPQTPAATVTIGGLTATGTWSQVTNVDQETTFTASGNFTGTLSANPGMSRANPTVSWPTNLTATYGQTLAEITLPGNGTSTPAGIFTWATPSTAVGEVGIWQHNMNFTPTDTVNFNPLENYPVDVAVSAAIIINPAITITAPVVAIPPNTIATIATLEPNFTAGAVIWTPAYDPFRGATAFTAQITLTAAANHTFTGISTAIINDTIISPIANTGGTATLSFTFPATAAASVTGISIAAQPDTLIYYVGQELNLAGLLVTLAYDDTTTREIDFADFAANGITADPPHGTIITAAHNNTPITIAFSPGITANTAALTTNQTPEDGTAANPFIIRDENDLLIMGRGYNHRGGVWSSSAHYILGGNINLDHTANWLPIPGDFSGVFDGRGFEIHGLSSSGANAGGLFARIEGGAVRNVALIGIDINRTGANTGGIANAISGGTIENVFVSGNITNNSTVVGGIVGNKSDANALVINSVSAVTVLGTGNVGGIVGFGATAGTASAAIRNTVSLATETALPSGTSQNSVRRILPAGAGSTLANNHARKDMALLPIGVRTPASGINTNDGACITHFEWNNHDWWRTTAFANSQTPEEWGFMQAWIDAHIIGHIPDVGFATVTTNGITTGFATLQAAISAANAPGIHTVTILADQYLAPVTLANGANITLTAANAATVTLYENGSMFTIGAGATLVLGNNITLRGIYGNNAPLVIVNENGTFEMHNNTAVTGNIIPAPTPVHVGGVYVLGTFRMHGGAIHGNTGRNGGGVRVNNGVFYMLGGEIFNNEATNVGGGVRVEGSGAVGGRLFVVNGLISGTGGREASDPPANRATAGVTSVLSITVGGAGRAQYGIMDNGSFVPHGSFGVDVSHTIEVSNGELLRPERTVRIDSQYFIDIAAALVWANAQPAGEHTITILQDQYMGQTTIAPNVNITLAADSPVNIRLGANGSLFNVGGALTIGDNITLHGRGTNTARNNRPVVEVLVGGRFYMLDGSAITGNNTSYFGGAVLVRGIFTMNGGEIFGNLTNQNGGAVQIEQGRFYMNGGTIRNNTANAHGGGVSLGSLATAANNAGFFMRGGIIYGECNPDYSNIANGAPRLGVAAHALNNFNGSPAEFWDGVAWVRFSPYPPATMNIPRTIEMRGGLLIRPLTTATVTTNNATRHFTTLQEAIAAANTPGTHTVTIFTSQPFAPVVLASGANISLYAANPVTIQLSTYGNMFLIPDGAVLTLNDGITLRGHSSNNGVLVGLTGGEFIMNGGIITGNTFWGPGGGVGLSRNSTFIMHDGTITGNSSGTQGGGVFVGLAYPATFIMHGGTISGNTANQGGGVFIENSALHTFQMSGGTIYGICDPANANTADEGGALYGSGQFGTFAGGVFTPAGNLATEDRTIEVRNGELIRPLAPVTVSTDGGVATPFATLQAAIGAIYNVSGEHIVTILADQYLAPVDLEGGVDITLAAANPVTVQLYAPGFVGAMFFIRDGATLTVGNYVTLNGIDANEHSVIRVHGNLVLDGGTISGNEAQVGGGVQVYVGGTFTMYRGNISGNTARFAGGGVRVLGTMNMHDGTISGNTAQRGGGIELLEDQFGPGGVLRMSGGTIYGTDGGANENTAGTGAALNVRSGTTAQRGTFTGPVGAFVPDGYLYTENRTIVVQGGDLISPSNSSSLSLTLSDNLGGDFAATYIPEPPELPEFPPAILPEEDDYLLKEEEDDDEEDPEEDENDYPEEDEKEYNKNSKEALQ